MLFEIGYFRGDTASKTILSFSKRGSRFWVVIRTSLPPAPFSESSTVFYRWCIIKYHGSTTRAFSLGFSMRRPSSSLIMSCSSFLGHAWLFNPPTSQIRMGHTKNASNWPPRVLIWMRRCDSIAYPFQSRMPSFLFSSSFSCKSLKLVEEAIRSLIIVSASRTESLPRPSGFKTCSTVPGQHQWTILHKPQVFDMNVTLTLFNVSDVL